MTRVYTRLLVVGPTRPLRGGIPLYTSAMIRHLAQTYDVRAVTFKRLYPKRLYPGKLQYESSPNQDGTTLRAYEFDPFSINSWWQLRRVLRYLEYDVILTPWWTTFWTPLYIFMKLCTKAPIVYLCHNFLPHDRHILDFMALRLALGVGDGYVAFSRSVGQEIMSTFPGRPLAVCNLPSIAGELGISLVPKDQARRQLGIGDNIRVLIFWGIVRKYKGLDILIDAMSMISRPDVCLFVVGEFWDDEKKYVNLINRRGLRERVWINGNYLPIEEIRIFLSAADVVVLPYKKTSQSSILRLVLDLGIPAVVAAVPGLQDQVTPGDPVLFHRPGDAAELASRIREALDSRNWLQHRAETGGRSDRGDGWTEFELSVRKVLTTLGKVS